MYVSTRSISRPVRCGCVEMPNGQPIECPKCGWSIDRHLSAAINILKAQDDVLRFGMDSLPHVAVDDL